MKNFITEHENMIKDISKYNSNMEEQILNLKL